MVQWLGLRAFTAEGAGSIPGQETKIPQAVWHGQKKKIYEYYSGAIKWKRPIGQGRWEGASSFHALSGHTFLTEPPCVHQPGSYLNPILLGFQGVFNTQTWMIKSLILILLAPVPSPWVVWQWGREGPEIPILKSQGWFPLATSPILININLKRACE